MNTRVRLMVSLVFLSGLTSSITISVSAQSTSTSRKVSGKVTDETGNGLSSVTVTVKGSKVATQTDENGNYTVNTPSNATLVFTSVGYAANEVAARGRSTVNATL